LPEKKTALNTIEALNTKINELEKELAQVKAERDKYWDAVAGKVGEVEPLNYLA
jgi:chorismate mutase